MSSREPMWFCHECHAEMRPLMMPDPVCASCRGSFVEKIENTQDDPREFAHEDPGMVPPGHPVDDNDIFTNLQSLIDLGMRTQPGPRPPRPSGLAFQVHGPQGTRVIRIGGGPSPHEPDRVPTMSSFLGPSGFTPQPPSPGDRRGGIGAPLLAHYLMAMLGPHDPRAFGFPADGRMGDYVFNQEALDQIMTQLMENSNAHRPVPAPEDVVDKLPREVLVEGSATLQKDCAVCKETFSLTTEDPDEQVVITLPCKHPFHEPCILPWLKSSATCPVCRFALVPQPGQPTPPDASGSSGSGSSSSPPRPNPGYRSGPSTPPSDNSNNNNSRPPASPSGGGGGLFQNLYDTLTGHRHSNQNSRDRQRDREGEGDRDRGERDRHNDEQHSRTGQRNSPWSRSPTFSQPNPRRSSSDPRSERRTSPRNLDGSTGGTRSPPSNPYRPSSPSHPHGNNNSSRGNERRRSSRANNLPGSWGEELD